MSRGCFKVLVGFLCRSTMRFRVGVGLCKVVFCAVAFAGGFGRICRIWSGIRG